MMKKIEQKVLNFISGKNLLAPNDRVLIALSGGPDSVFLIHFLNKYSKKLKVILGAVHINHLLRGKEADKDEKFCKKLSKKLSINFFSERKDIRSKASKEKVSLEEAGRIIRYKVFEEISAREGYNKIATAHNADENAETVLLNLIKGSGPKGLSGIPPSRGKIIRPLLILNKKEILDYLDHQKIKFRTDLTNLSDDAERNFLRNKVIPLIKKRLNPSLSNTLLKSSDVFRNIINLITKKILESADSLFSQGEDYVSISLKKFNNVEYEYRSELLRYIFDKKFNIQISFDDCNKILSLMEKQTGKAVRLSKKIEILKERDELIIQKERNEKSFRAVTLTIGDSVEINDAKLSITEAGTIKEKFSPDKNQELISGDDISRHFLLRQWESGDKFYPLGMKGSKKVSDFLNEQKILSSEKKQQIVLVNRDRIVWVVGIRLDDRFKVTDQTKKVYQLCLS